MRFTMNHLFRVISALGCMSLVACPTSEADSDGGPAGGNGSGAVDGDGDTGGSSDAGTPTDSRPVLDTAGAQVAGRQGQDVVVSFSGRDLDKDAAYIFLRFADASGGAITAVDLDQDGTKDSEGLTSPDDAIAGLGSFSGTVTLERFAQDFPQVTKITIAIEDTSGQRSTELNAAILPQPVIPLDGACDVTGFLNRCVEPYSCRGEPATCQDRVAPTLIDYAYLRHEGGPRILVAGIDPDDDVTGLFVEFLDAQGNPVDVDFDGDDNPDASFFDNDITGASSEGEFFYGIYPSEGFELQVPKLALTVRDSGNRESNRVVVSLANITQRSAGQSCDLRGFTECRSGYTCLENAAGTATTCQSVNNAISAMCAEAPTLTASTTPVSTFVSVSGQGVFDPPEGCSSQDPTGRPDAVVKVRLQSSVSSLVLSTQSPATTFDTILYVLDSCSAGAIPTVERCNDDAPGGGSVLTLTNVPAGDYTVVVDSWDPGEGTAELTVSTD